MWIPNILYRIGIINNFNNSRCFVDFKQFGNNKFISAFFTRAQHKGYTISSDRIDIFINFEPIFITKLNTEALKKIEELIYALPKEASYEIELFKEYLNKPFK